MDKQEISPSEVNTLPDPPSNPLEREIHRLLEQSEVLFPYEQALVLAAAAAALNEPKLLRAAITSGFAYNATPLALYESLLQTYLFAGFPAALEALAVLQALCKEQKRDFTPPPAAPHNEALFQQRGKDLCQQIYTTAYNKMRQKLLAISPDLAEWMIVEGYGKTLSRPELSARMRELVIVGVLAVLGWNTQLYSHLRGAMNVGATPVECIDTLYILSFLAEHSTDDVQPLLRKRIAAAQATLTALLDDTNRH